MLLLNPLSFKKDKENYKNVVMKKCLLMLGLLLFALFVAMVTGLSENDSPEADVIVETNTNYEFLTDLENN